MHSPAPIAKKAPVFRGLPYIGGAALVALLAFGLRPQPTTVETAHAINGTLRATVSEEGKTRIRQRYVVSSPVTGQLRRVPFKPGAEITAASIVAVIEPLAASPPRSTQPRLSGNSPHRRDRCSRKKSRGLRARYQ